MDDKLSSKKQDDAALQTLPLKVLIGIFSYLKASDMAKFGMTCRFFYQFLEQNSLTIFQEANINFPEYEQQKSLSLWKSLSHWKFFCKVQNEKPLNVVLLGNAKNSRGSSIQTLLTLCLSSSEFNIEGHTPYKLADATLLIWSTVGLEQYPALHEQVCKNQQIAIVIPASQTDLDTQLNNLEKYNVNAAVFIVYLDESLMSKNLTPDKEEKAILLTDNMRKKPQLLFERIIQTLKNQSIKEDTRRNHKNCVLQ